MDVEQAVREMLGRELPDVPVVEHDEIPGQHEPWCDSQLGPEYEVVDGVLRMTVHVCLGCKRRA